MIALKDKDHRKIPSVAEKKIELPKPTQGLIDSKILGGVLDVMAQNIKLLTERKDARPLTEVKVSAPPVREYVIKHVWDKNDNRITESIITVRGDK